MLSGKVVHAQYSMKVCGGSKDVAPRIHNLSSGWSGWSASRLGRFTTGKGFLVPIEREVGWVPEAPAGNKHDSSVARGHSLVTIPT
jgi:hypothetical protein